MVKSPLDDCLTERSLITIVAIIGLVILETAALVTNHDGAMLIPVAAAVAGLGGYKIGEQVTIAKNTLR